MKTITEPSREIPVMAEVDVIVAGGGVAGWAAAVAVGRKGARTMLVERNGILGGVATAGLMSSMCQFFVDHQGSRLVGGIPLELIEKLSERGAVSPQSLSPEMPQIPFDQEAFRTLLFEMTREAEVETLLHCWVVDVVQHDDQLRGVIIESKSGRQAILGKVVIDATGDADVAARAGAPFNYEPPSNDSLLFLMDNVDMQKTYEYFKEHEELWELIEKCDVARTFEQFERNWLERGMFHTPHGGGCVEGSPLWLLVEEAVKNGDYARSEGSCNNLDAFALFGLGHTGTMVINTGFFGWNPIENRVHEPLDSLNVKDASRIEIDGRMLIPYVANFLRKYLPGFESAGVCASACDLGVRYTRYIVGDHILTAEEVGSRARFDDVIGVWFFDIPYGVMVPRQVENLLVASGKSVSTEGQGNSRGILRLQPHCMILGEAAGTAAALCADSGVSPRTVDIKELQRALLRQDVYLGDKARLAGLGLT